MYQQDSSHTAQRRTSAVREQLRQPLTHKMTNSCRSSVLRMRELEEAIRALKCQKTLGPDGVSNVMIRHFGNNAKHMLPKNLQQILEFWSGSIHLEKGTHCPNSQERKGQTRPQKLQTHQPTQLPRKADEKDSEPQADMAPLSPTTSLLPFRQATEVTETQKTS